MIRGHLLFACSFVIVVGVGACGGDGGGAVLSDIGGEYAAGPDLVTDALCTGGECLDAADAAVDVTPELVDTNEVDAGCGDCSPDLFCEPGSTKCEGNAVTACAEDGSMWELAVPCQQLESCIEGECLPFPEGECGTVFDCMAEVKCLAEDFECMTPCVAGATIGVALYAKELFWCVHLECNGWDPTAECFEEALVGECKTLYVNCTGNCIPFCGNAECGDDGCGGSCGECEEGYACDANGHCLCQPQCEGKECGPNGCGAQCGVCAGRKPVCSPEGLCVPEDPGPCGNGECEPGEGESCFNCPIDCGECPPCGDGSCDEGEECTFCPEDCGPCDFGDCCAYHDFPGCEDADVVACVCGQEPDCCLYPWINDCVELAIDCGAECD